MFGQGYFERGRLMLALDADEVQMRDMDWIR